MKPDREIDARIAKEVLGYEVQAKGEVLYETTPQGQRPLPRYSREMGWAQEVMEKMKMTVIPIQGNEWFVFVGPEDRTGWESPVAVLQFLEAGNFTGCGAASGNDLPALICEAALKAVEKRLSEKVAAAAEVTLSGSELPDNVRPIH